MAEAYQPIYELTRGRVVESIHFGAVAVVDSGGRLLAWYGDPKTVTFMRSSAKPFQALPFIERGGDQTFHLTSKEVAIICASHDGTDEHVEVVKGIQSKVGVQESDLMCGIHPPNHLPTFEAMKARGEVPTQNRHNCSGKHTGMLAHARMRGLPISDYINPKHPVQRTILETFAEMCGLSPAQVELGIDGCSAPSFAVPLYNAALALARLCGPRGLSAKRAAACRRITSAMMANPLMVGGPGRFDTRLMEVCSGHLIAKGGAEGYMVVGVMAGFLGADSPGIGIVFKISDGDVASHSGSDINLRVRPAVSLEILRQMGYISTTELEALSEFGPVKQVLNWRKLVVGEGHPAFTLQRADAPGMTDLEHLAWQVHQRLLDFYGKPVWRKPLPPLDELFSTILSQNTNDANRDRAFNNLKANLPTWEAVREADPGAVIAAIRPAGLANQKGPRIQQVLRQITTERGSLDLSFLKDLPLEEARSWLTKFKGVGPKTAAIVLLFSLGRPAFPVDTHIYRVTGRIGLRPEKMTVESAHSHLERLLPPDTYYVAHLNIIRLGREICLARHPACAHCPVQQLCNYSKKDSDKDKGI